MIRFCIWLLERTLVPELASHVIGDLVEQQERGPLWMLAETISAIWHLHARPRAVVNLLSSVLADLRVAARLLSRSPAFALVSVLTLGLAIGATTSIFSVIEPVLLKPLPYSNAEQLVLVWEQSHDGGRENVGFATFRDLVEQSHTLESAAAMGEWQPTLSDHGDPERVRGDRVSWSYFRTLGIKPMLGRDFLQSEDLPGNDQVVILSYGLWQRRFGGDSSIVGNTISISGKPVTVAGVMPADFDNALSPTAKIWRVLGYLNQSYACRTCHHLRILARMRPGVTPEMVQTEFGRIKSQLVKAYPKEYATDGMLVGRAQNEITTGTRPALLALAGAVVLVLLIAVANVVSLQLARAIRRAQEFAVRGAVGARRGRIVRQLLTEGMLLAALGGAAGLVVAFIALPVLVAKLPQNLPRLSAIHLDTGALAVVMAIVLLVSIVMGLAPAGGRFTNFTAALNSGRRLSGGASHRTRAALVVGEVALAMMLLVSAGLLGRSLVRLLDVNVGFEPSHLLTLEINSSGARYASDTSVFDFHDRVRDAVRTLPGVVSVAVANQIPFGGNVDMYGVMDPDNMLANPELSPSADRYTVSTEYLQTMRIPVIEGRGFTVQDGQDGSNKIALVSTSLARRLWPNESALGRRIHLGERKNPSYTVVGVVGDIHHSGLDEKTTMQWYIPERQFFQSDNQEALIVRTAGDPAALAPAVRSAIAAIDPTQPIVKIATMDELVVASTGQRRLALALFGAFAAAALLLAIAGIYGVLAGTVSERTREIGVRSALGATPGSLIALIVGQGGRLAALGIGLGLAGSFALTRYLQSLLFGVAPNDLPTLAAVCVLLAGVTVAACFVPATRAARVDPSIALRSE